MPGQVLHKVPLFGWAIFITAILLLLALPVLAGIFILLALNLVICWKLLFLIYVKVRQSAGNRKGLSLSGYLRDYTPKFIYYKNYYILTAKCIYYKNYSNLTNVGGNKDKRYFKLNLRNNILANFNDNFAYYLTGLIEGDGTIIVPKTERSENGRLNYPSIQIAFDMRDLPLARLIKKN